ncbi:MAG: phosphotransferase [Candidatus Bipolaricaulota bacterium]|nr:phosphotransferase [Candidatus Bipolaricaulota bacterium]
MQLLRDLLSSIGEFREPDHVEPLRGLSNRNFLVTMGQDEYVVRLASPNAECLGISREAEAAALRLAEGAGLGPDVVRYVFPEGHLIAKPIAAQPFSETPNRYRELDTLRSVVRIVRRVHALPALDHTFNPFARIRASFERAAEARVALPAGSARILRRLDEIEATRGPLVPPYLALCHNDLFAGNLLDADPIRLIDWEFAGMGDVFFDLATLLVSCDETAPLPDAHRHAILDEYFGEERPEHRRRLDDMVLVVQLHVVAWALTHHTLGTPEHGWEGFTFLGFATDLLTGLITEL